MVNLLARRTSKKRPHGKRFGVERGVNALLQRNMHSASSWCGVEIKRRPV